ncbi:MAG: ABC transporter ATP-binding protein [Oscillospiraceae bacterium]|nr:ABC transporter ATP-binding protein [Oscillospiraceae bacterium]
MNEINKNIPLLSVNDLTVEFPMPAGTLRAVSALSYDVYPGEVMGIVGESGSGKSVAASSVMHLLQKPGRVTEGSITFDGRDVLSMTKKELNDFRGKEISMIFQDPMQCLDPSFTVGSQLMETVRAHEKVAKAEARGRCVDVLASVGIKDPESMMKKYPFELSGGMRQRVMIAIALLCRPKLLIADEPTTALDVTIQEQIMLLLKKACSENEMAMVFITHNFGLVADICDRVTVMYGGRVMEQGSCDDIFYSTAHPYTCGLMQAIPKADLLSEERLTSIEGTPLDPMAPPAGCPFAPRCNKAMDICHRECPELREIAKGHRARCWLCEDDAEVSIHG